VLEAPSQGWDGHELYQNSCACLLSNSMGKYIKKRQ